MSMTHDEMIAVIQAHKEGALIQVQAVNGSGIWMQAATPNWDFSAANYRIKPEPPKTREFWIPPAAGSICVSAHPIQDWIHVREVLD